MPKKKIIKLILEQQRRQDFDVIFLLTQPERAREIVPLLKYYYAEMFLFTPHRLFTLDYLTT